MKKRILIPALALLLVFALAVPSFAWFARASVIISGDDPHKLSASSKSAYFASGDGTADNPYVLSNEVHLYNLAWLQYIGYFNKGEVNNSLDQTYFVLEDNIDANGLTIPPIGTTEYPFIGNFDGNNYCISNINTANVSTAFDLKPSNSEFKVNSLLTKFSDKAAAEVGNVMGFFGVIGSYSGEATASNVDASVTAVKNFGLTDYTLTSSSETTTVGFVAGYVSAKLENVLVCNCTINTPSVNGGVANTDHASEYTLVGYSTDPESLKENNVTVYDPTVTTEIIGSGSGGVGEEGSGFGGSLNMADFADRLAYLITENLARQTTVRFEVDSKYTYSTKPEIYPYGFQYGISNNPTWKFYADYCTDHPSVTSQIAISVAPVGTGNNQIASCFPVSVSYSATEAENEQIDINGGTDKASTVYNKYPRYTTQYYHSRTTESVDESNTGYLVSSTIIASININLDVISRIYKAFSDNGNVSTFSSTDLQLITVSADGTEYIITDGVTGSPANKQNGLTLSNRSTAAELNLKRYQSVVDTFANTFNNRQSVPSLRFLSGTTYDSNLNRVPYGVYVSDGTVQYDKSRHTVQLNNGSAVQTFTDYELVEGSLNFKVNEPGYITAVAGTYYNSSGGHKPFALYKTTRSGNSIDGLVYIEKVYVHKTDSTQIRYNSLNSGDNGEDFYLAYDASTYNMSENNALYYIEIPVTAGEYVISGDATGGNDAPYLLYLDIGANAGEGAGSDDTAKVISEYIEESENEYKYVSGVTVAEIGADGATVDNAPLGNIAIRIAGDNRQSVTVSRNGDEISVSGGTLAMLGAGLTSAENAIPTPTVGTSTVTRRRTYVHSDGTKITVTRINEDDSTITVTAKDGEGQDIAITENTTTDGVTTVKTANRTYTVTWADIKPTAAVIAYTYTAAGDATVTNSPVFTVSDSGTVGSYKVTVSATETATVTVTANTDGAVAKGNTVEAGSNVTIDP